MRRIRIRSPARPTGRPIRSQFIGLLRFEVRDEARKRPSDGRVFLGDATLGNTPLGDTTFGDATLGNTTLGNATLRNTAFGDTALGGFHLWGFHLWGFHLWEYPPWGCRPWGCRPWGCHLWAYPPWGHFLWACRLWVFPSFPLSRAIPRWRRTRARETAFAMSVGGTFPDVRLARAPRDTRRHGNVDLGRVREDGASAFILDSLGPGPLPPPSPLLRSTCPSPRYTALP